MYKTIVGILAFSSSVVLAGDANDTLQIVVFGRSNFDAMTTAYFNPYRQVTGATITSGTYDGRIDDLAAMVKAGKTVWDVMQVETGTLEPACRDGLFEKLDLTKIGNRSDFVRGSVSECGIGIFAWSQALAYDPGKFAATPKSWADFWDIKRFPGKRGLRRSAKYTLEIALLADGVAPADIYTTLATKPGVDRAFRKLDRIKNDIVWWEAAPQPALYLAAGKVAMSSAYTLWIDAEQKRGKNVEVVWKGSLYDFDNWAIPKNAPHIAEAYRFVAFASRPENQKAFSLQLAYGPTNTKALSMMQPELASKLPTADKNLTDAVQVNASFWIKHRAELEERFDQWAPQIYKQQVEEEDEPHPGTSSVEHEH